MDHHDAFLEFIGNLEYLRQKQRLTPDAAASILSGVPLTIYAGQEGEAESEADTRTTKEAEARAETSTTTKTTDPSGATVSGNP